MMNIKYMLLAPLKRVLVFLLFAGLAQWALAVPLPPLILCDGQACNHSGPSGYDLSGYDIPFSYSWPTPPNINSEAIVTPATLASNNVNGRRLILTPGSYGNVSPANDQEWILQDGVEIDVFTYDASQRVVVRGENPRDGRIGSLEGSAHNPASDILFDGITQMNGPWTGQYNTKNDFQGSRIAIVNSSLNARGYVVWGIGETENATNNIIIAGNYLRADEDLPVTSDPGSSFGRMMSVNRVVFVGNYMYHNTAGLGMRFHCTDPRPGQDLSTHDIYFADNLMVGSDRTSGVTYFSTASNTYTPDPFYNLTIEDNHIYVLAGGVMRYDGPATDGSVPTNVVIRNNRGYGNGAGWPDPNNSSGYDITGWTIEGNVANLSMGAIPSPQSKLGFDP